MLTMHPSSLLFLCVVVKSLVIVTLRHCDPRVALKGYAARWRLLTDVTSDSGASVEDIHGLQLAGEAFPIWDIGGGLLAY